MKQAIKRYGITAAVVVMVLGGVALFNDPEAQARFVSAGRSVSYDGAVSDVGSNEFTVVTSGGDEITVDVGRRTRFTRGTSFETLEPGDRVSVLALRRSGDLEALLVRPVSGSAGYGSGPATVTRGEITDVGTDEFTVETNGVEVTFHITPQTRFFRTSEADLSPGDNVLVNGRDTPTGFVARTVIGRR